MKNNSQFQASSALVALALFVFAPIVHGVPSSKDIPSNADYVALERSISRRVHGGERPKALQAEYRAQVLSDQTNSLAVFGWAFASLEDFRGQDGILVGNWAMEQVLAHDNPKNSREYTRVWFALVQQAYPAKTHPEFYKAVEAALQAKPQDIFLRERLVYDLINDTKTLPKAVALAQQGVDFNPQSARPHSLLASAYQDVWIVSRRPADAQKAVTEYRKFLALAAPNDPFRHDAQYLIKTIQQMASLKS